MKKRYEEIMEKVEVTCEMRNRILDQIQNTDFGPLTSAHLQLEQKKQVQYKKHLRAAACLVILLINAAAMPELIGSMGTSGPTGPVNPNAPSAPGSLAGPNGPNESQVQIVPDIGRNWLRFSTTGTV